MVDNMVEQLFGVAARRAIASFYYLAPLQNSEFTGVD